jgi:hypothetical protein
MVTNHDNAYLANIDINYMDRGMLAFSLWFSDPDKALKIILSNQNDRGISKVYLNKAP